MGLQNHDMDVFKHFENGMQSQSAQPGAQGELSDYAALMSMLQGDELEVSTHTMHSLSKGRCSGSQGLLPGNLASSTSPRMKRLRAGPSDNINEQMSRFLPPCSLSKASNYHTMVTERSTLLPCAHRGKFERENRKGGLPH